MKIRRLDLDETTINEEHAQLGLPPIEYEVAHASEHPLLRIIGYAIIAILLALVIFLTHRLFFGSHEQSGLTLVNQALHSPVFWTALFVGLLAQTIDGALGMAYGITSSSFLLATGAPPAVASGATHLAEVFTTGLSGFSHIKLGNVNKKLFLSLVIPGIIGALLGTYVLTNIDGHVLKPFINAYLLLMGLYVLSKAFRHIHLKQDIRARKVAPLAVLGGFVDTTGGGGWGPVVTTSLIGAGHNPRTTIGSVNLAEFFLTIVVATAFFALLDSTVWVIVAGLVIGGMFAAPLAALATRHFKTKTLLILVGCLITGVSIFNLSKLFIS